MHKTLDDLFCGNINPFEAPRYHDTELYEAQQLFNKLMEKVEKKLGDRDLFERLTDSLCDLTFAQERVLFCDGFRLGLRIATECFTPDR